MRKIVCQMRIPPPHIKLTKDDGVGDNMAQGRQDFWFSFRFGSCFFFNWYLLVHYQRRSKQRCTPTKWTIKSVDRVIAIGCYLGAMCITLRILIFSSNVHAAQQSFDARLDSWLGCEDEQFFREEVALSSDRVFERCAADDSISER
ncbi:hypothetical protein BDP27DRAFT_1369558 [Rhodocollybia butyracea]|uniref:Transmembrane protein n=1 Tax=Rhodocollybia butyracea TaxID=206335 RepID=A0A9P5U0L2_9AGAR|nr:hypothetical protein BDP27DRAFT_1369558 [Rhodocollybia butyracea]